MTNLNLMTHCGSIRVPREQIFAEPPTPETDTHFPINHGVLLDMIDDELGNIGFKVVNEAHALGRDGMQYFGMLELASRALDYTTIVGLRNSHDMSLAAGIAVGSGVFVCDNLAFSGEIKISRKHTRGIMEELPYKVAEAVGGIKALEAKQELRIEAYKEKIVPARYGDALVIEMYRRGIINIQRVPRVIQEWDNPTHLTGVNDNGDKTVWTLFNAATEALKPKGPTALLELPQKTIRLHGLMDELSEIPLAA